MNDPQQRPQQQPQNVQRAPVQPLRQNVPSAPGFQPATPAPLSTTSAATSTATPAQPQEAVRIVFFCKDCYQLVDAQKIGRKYVYRCPTCHTKNVAFGTEKSIKSFYHVEDRKVEKVEEKKAA